MALTTLGLKALNATKHGQRLSDGASMFGVVRANSDGAVSVDFEWRYRFAGKTRQMRVGTWPKSSLAELRSSRDVFKGELQSGIDPIAKRGDQRQAATAQAETERLKTLADQAEAVRVQQQRLVELAALDAHLTVSDAVAKWIGTALVGRRDKGSETRRSFTKDVIPAIGMMAVEDVQRRHIADILDTIKARAGDTQTTMVKSQKKTLADLRQFFGWCVERELIERDPTERISKAGIGKDVERERVLSEVELIDLMRKLPTSGLTEAAQCVLMIQLATACRIGEVLAAKWADVDLVGKTWRIPASTAKNGKAHEVSLSDFAMTWFEHLHTMTGIVQWLMPNSRQDENGHPTSHIDLKALTKQTADRQRTDGLALPGRTQQTTSLVLAGGKWTPHDLRRTAATTMAELDVLPDVIERCLNHVEPSKVRRIYQRASYAGHMRDAWQVLGNRLELLHQRAQGHADNVVPLRKTA